MITINKNNYDPYIGASILEKVTVGSSIIWERNTGETHLYIGSIFRTDLVDDKFTLKDLGKLSKKEVKEYTDKKIEVETPRSKYAEDYDNEDDYYEAMLDGDEPFYPSQEEFDDDNEVNLIFLRPLGCLLKPYIPYGGPVFNNEYIPEHVTIDGSVYEVFVEIKDKSKRIIADYNIKTFGTFEIKK